MVGGAPRAPGVAFPAPRAQVAALAPVEKILREPDLAGRITSTHCARTIGSRMPGLPAVGAGAPDFRSSSVGRAALAFIAFNLCASSLYLLNDLLDLPADRRHPHKKERRLASGRVRLAHALVLMPLLLIGAFLIAAQLSAACSRCTGAVLVLMIGYSMKLKDLAIVDVLVLAVGYALRVAAGAFAVGIGISAWLLTFCVFLFFSLALIKRYAELVTSESAPGAEPRTGLCGQRQADAGGAGHRERISGGDGVGALHEHRDQPAPAPGHDFFWGVCLVLLYWVSYLWMMAGRGRIRDDPVMFALSDRGSLWTIAVMGLFALLAI